MACAKPWVKASPDRHPNPSYPADIHRFRQATCLCNRQSVFQNMFLLLANPNAVTSKGMPREYFGLKYTSQGISTCLYFSIRSAITIGVLTYQARSRRSSIVNHMNRVILWSTDFGNTSFKISVIAASTFIVKLAHNSEWQHKPTQSKLK